LDCCFSAALNHLRRNKALEALNSKRLSAQRKLRRKAELLELDCKAVRQARVLRDCFQ
jgi:hypothetical protein